MALANAPWPNQQEPLDGVTPVAEVSQDPDLFKDEPVDLNVQMGG